MDVTARLAALAQLSSSDLRNHWYKMKGETAPRVSPSLLRLALAWELQAADKGGLPGTARRKLEQFAAGKSRTTSVGAGTRLVREWRGELHTVTVTDDGRVTWRGDHYRSLSEVARAITGTRWSGPAFFGLKQRITP